MRWSGEDSALTQTYPFIFYYVFYYVQHSASSTRLVKVTKHEVWRDDHEQDNLPKVRYVSAFPSAAHPPSLPPFIPFSAKPFGT